MTKIEKGFSLNVSTNLLLRIANSPEEIDKIAQFNLLIHQEEGIDLFVKRLFSDHPNTKNIYWLYIENIATMEIIASLALLPLKWKIGDQEFKVAEMGYVGTLDAYRGQGLFGIMNTYYEKIAVETGCLLSTLRGIPYYYRKYGYEFALPLLGGYRLSIRKIPSETEETMKIRKITDNDLKDVKTWYENSMKNFCVSMAYDENEFIFRMMNSSCDQFHSMSYVVEQDRKPVGFFSLGSLHDPNSADLILVSELTENQMIKVLNFLKSYNIGSIDEITINVSHSSNFGKFISDIGGIQVKPWAWQVKIMDLKAFLVAIKTELEKRVENSIFKESSRELTLSDYKQIITIHFIEGKIQEITSKIAYPDRSVEVRIPKPVLTKLLLSDRTVDEINYIITDTIVKKDSKLFVDTLFPKLPSFPDSLN
ncbi:MAG: GNAT family N-acetyltransferase [Candidatus Kariarchaeaceae archaeon]